ncbi:hypothetical protein ACVIQY_000784 [Bradyrhizobium sp. USDA 3051]
MADGEADHPPHGYVFIVSTMTAAVLLVEIAIIIVLVMI